jgi:hypothetical protein
MKKQYALILLLALTTGIISAQSSFEKYLSASLITADNARLSSMKDLTKKVQLDTLEKIPLKITLTVTREGNVMKQELMCGKADGKLAKKLFDLLNEAILKKFGKPQMDETVSGTKNCFWKAQDKTILTLGNTENMTTLTMLKMQY